MEWIEIIFYALSAVVVISAIAVVTSKNVMYSALYLALSLGGVAGIFLLLSADFLAVVQIILYVSGVMVLMLFVIMLTHRVYDRAIEQINKQREFALIFGLVVFTTIAYCVIKVDFAQVERAFSNTTWTIGNLLLSDYVLPFEVASVLLLAAMVGAIVLTKKEPTRVRKRESEN